MSKRKSKKLKTKSRTRKYGRFSKKYKRKKSQTRSKKRSIKHKFSKKKRRRKKRKSRKKKISSRSFGNVLDIISASKGYISVALLFTLFLVLFLNNMGDSNTTFEALALTMGTVGFGSDYIKGRSLEYLTSSARPMLPTFLKNDPKEIEMIKIVTQKYKELKPYLSEEFDEIFKHVIDSLEFKAKSLSNHVDEHTTKEARALLDYINYMFTLSENVDIEFTDQQKNELFGSVDNLLKTYKASEQELRNKVLKPLLTSLLSKDEKTPPIAPIFLLGSAGVGKTKFVKDLAEIIGIPMIDYESGRESRFYINEPNHFQEKYLNPITKLAKLMKEKKTSAGIIFIDELDKKLGGSSKKSRDDEDEDSWKSDKLHSTLLELLNPDKKTQKDRYLGVDIPMNNILVICSANELLTDINKKYEPLQSRFTLVKFPDINQELKLEIAKKYFQELGHDPSKYTTEISRIVTDDKNPGVRSILNEVNTFTSSLISREMFRGTVWDEPEGTSKIQIIKPHKMMSFDSDGGSSGISTDLSEDSSVTKKKIWNPFRREKRA